MRSLVIVISCGLVAAGCESSRPTSGGPTEPAAASESVAPRTALGVVGGGPWMVGGPPKHARWHVIDALDERYDIVPVDLDRGVPSGVGLLIVPLLTALTQPQLDRLGSAIDAGLPAIVIVDPLPAVDLRFLPSEPLPTDDNGFFGASTPSEPKGDAIGFLSRFGVAWKADDVLVGEPFEARRGEAIIGDGVGGKLGPIVFSFAGALTAAVPASAQPLFVARGTPKTRGADAYVGRHPLFGPQLVTPRTGDARADGARRVLALRVASDEGGARGELVVFADLDAFSNSAVGPGVDVPATPGGDAMITAGNRGLLQQLVARTLGPGEDAPQSTPGAPLLEPHASRAITAIDLVARHPMPAELASAPPALEWFRLERRANDWWVVTKDTELADPARIEALLEMLTAVRWEARSPDAIAPIDPGTSATSNAMRIVAHDEHGATIADLLIGRGAGSQPARMRFESATRTVRLAAEPPLRASAYLRALQLGPARGEIASAKVTTYRIDTAQGKIVDPVELPASAAALDALLAARFTPHERFGGDHAKASVPALGDLGFYTSGDKFFGSIGHVVVSRKRGKDCTFYFGEVRDGARLVLVEDPETAPDTLVVYRLSVVDARSILVGTPR